MKDTLKYNQSGFSANSWLQRKHRQRGGKKETDERKSAIPKGDFPLSFFLDFSPTQNQSHFSTSCRAGTDDTQRNIQVFLLTNNLKNAV